MISFLSFEALRVKVILLVRLEKLQAVGDFRIHMPSLLSCLKPRLVLVVYPWQHTCLEKASGPVQISYVKFDPRTPYKTFREDTEVEPVHEPLRVGVVLEVEVVFELKPQIFDFVLGNLEP